MSDPSQFTSSGRSWVCSTSVSVALTRTSETLAAAAPRWRCAWARVPCWKTWMPMTRSYRVRGACQVPAKLKAGSVTAALSQKRSGRSL
jgi:hypothetical protein